MHNLGIDIGNTFTKIAVFENQQIVHYQRLGKLTVQDLKLLLNKFELEKSIISTVNEEVIELEDFLRANTSYTRFSIMLNNGVENKYKTPETLGLDRWAAVLGAKSLFVNTNCLIVDAGTCITYDLINSAHEYFGGSISPGIRMRFQALNHFTERLPLIDWQGEDEIPEGINTKSAVINGVLQGVVNEIIGFIAINNKQQSAFKVILTGGDATFLFKQLQNSIFAPQIVKDPYLVLKGLNEVIA